MKHTLKAWVAEAEPSLREFRQAVHIVLLAIAHDEELRGMMVMKGGNHGSGPWQFAIHKGYRLFDNLEERGDGTALAPVEV